MVYTGEKLKDYNLEDARIQKVKLKIESYKRAIVYENNYSGLQISRMLRDLNKTLEED